MVFANPIKSVVPSSVHQAVVTVPGHHPRLIPFRRVLSCARLGRLPERRGSAMSKPDQPPASNDESGPRIAKSKRASQRKEKVHPVFQPNAAGIDIGAREIYVAVPADRDDHPVRKCETFTGDLHQMADWLVQLWHHHGGDGIHRRLLDSGVRRTGAARHPAVSGRIRGT